MSSAEKDTKTFQSLKAQATAFVDLSSGQPSAVSSEQQSAVSTVDLLSEPSAVSVVNLFPMYQFKSELKNIFAEKGVVY